MKLVRSFDEGLALFKEQEEKRKQRKIQELQECFAAAKQNDRTIETQFQQSQTQAVAALEEQVQSHQDYAAAVRQLEEEKQQIVANYEARIAEFI